MEQPIDEVIAAVLAAAACPYRRLGIPPHTPREACRKSYLQLALKLHPDKCTHPRAKEAFAAVEEAFRKVA
jgi:curved DNA-binding protein CbpA